MTPTTAAQVPRNDFKAAHAYYLANQPLDADEYRILVHTFDDPEEFMARTSSWNVRQRKPRTLWEELVS